MTNLWKVIILLITLSPLVLSPAHSLSSSSWNYDTLAPSTNLTFASQLQHDLMEYHYTHDYEFQVFDCSDASIVCKMYLESKGYHVVAMAKQTSATEGHIWIAVKAPDGWCFVETTANMQTKLGTVEWGDDTNIYLTGLILDDPLIFLTADDPKYTRPSYNLDNSTIEPN